MKKYLFTIVFFLSITNVLAESCPEVCKAYDPTKSASYYGCVKACVISLDAVSCYVGMAGVDRRTPCYNLCQKLTKGEGVEAYFACEAGCNLGEDVGC